MSDPYRICVVCSGNICRSPMGEVVLRRAFEDAGLADRVVVDSAGTGSWHVGDGADPRTVAALQRRGYDGSAHRAKQWDPEWLAGRDLVLVADAGHRRGILAEAAREAGADHVRFVRAFDPDVDPDGPAKDLDLADPYYGDDDVFDACLDQVVRAAPGVVEHVRTQLDAR